MAEHVRWLANAAELLGGTPPSTPGPDYIGHLVPWRMDVARAMLTRIEQHTQRDWVTSIARMRRFSEYMIYGLYVDQVRTAEQARLLPTDQSLAFSLWKSSDLEGATPAKLLEGLAASQVGLCVQSFIDWSTEDLQALVARPILSGPCLDIAKLL